MGNHVHLFSEANHFPGIARGRRLVGRAMERISILWLLWCMLAGLLFMIDGKASKVDMGRCSMAGWMVGTLTFLLVLQAAVVMAPSEDLANWAFLLLQFSSCPFGMFAELLGLMLVFCFVSAVPIYLFQLSGGGKLSWKVLCLWLLSVAVTDYLPQTVELILAKNGEHHENHTVFPFGERLMKGDHFSNIQNASEWPESCQAIKEQDIVNNSTGSACYEWCREQLGYGASAWELLNPPPWSSRSEEFPSMQALLPNFTSAPIMTPARAWYVCQRVFVWKAFSPAMPCLGIPIAAIIAALAYGVASQSSWLRKMIGSCHGQEAAPYAMFKEEQWEESSSSMVESSMVEGLVPPSKSRFDKKGPYLALRNKTSYLPWEAVFKVH